MNKSTAVVVAIALVFLMLVYITGLGTYRDSLSQHQMVIEEYGYYGVWLNIHNPLDRCAFPILASYEETVGFAEVKGMEMCK